MRLKGIKLSVLKNCSAEQFFTLIFNFCPAISSFVFDVLLKGYFAFLLLYLAAILCLNLTKIRDREQYALSPAKPNSAHLGESE